MGISQSPEGRRLFPRMTVLENLEMGAFQRKRPGRDQGRTWTASSRSSRGSQERKNQKAGTLSGGEQQMCAIGRALMARPKLLMLDEPSMGLAPIFVEKIFEIIREINEQGTPILLVEQNALMALDAADRGYVLETGTIVLADDAKALSENEQVRRPTSASTEPSSDAGIRRRRTREREVRRGRAGSRSAAGRSARPCAIASAAPMPCVGTKPSCRAACGVAAARDEHGAEPLDRRLAGRPLGERQERVARAAAR